MKADFPTSQRLLTPWQWGWLALQLVVLGVAASVINEGNLPLLWQDPSGIQMVLWAIVLLVVNGLAFTGGCVLFNRFVAANHLVRLFLVGALATTCFFLLYLPVVFVLLYGPAAVAIQRNLTM
jgi:hypothetical protein